MRLEERQQQMPVGFPAGFFVGTRTHATQDPFYPTIASIILVDLRNATRRAPAPDDIRLFVPQSSASSQIHDRTN